MDSGSILVIRKQLTWSKVALGMYVFLSYVLVSVTWFFGGPVPVCVIACPIKSTHICFCSSFIML
uniref:Uncharacterized protein n=1 Tax=Arundo donax TaxID=35708 RepID=A0A0A9A932_ARUDO